MSRRLRSERTSIRSLWRSTSGASAVEFALVAAPFLLLVLGTLQVGLFYIAQSSLDTGVIKTADGLRDNFALSSPAASPNATTLKSRVVSNSGGLIRNDTSLAVEIRQLSALSSSAVAITDGTVDYGGITSTLVLRAKASVPTFWPGFNSVFQARSSAIVRREGH